VRPFGVVTPRDSRWVRILEMAWHPERRAVNQQYFWLGNSESRIQSLNPLRSGSFPRRRGLAAAFWLAARALRRTSGAFAENPLKARVSALGRAAEALSTLKPNLGVPRQPGRLLSPHRRPHSSLDYQPPAAFAATCRRTPALGLASFALAADPACTIKSIHLEILTRTGT